MKRVRRAGERALARKHEERRADGKRKSELESEGYGERHRQETLTGLLKKNQKGSFWGK